VLPLAASQASTDFLVQWTGADEGAGIQMYSIFVSENDGPFVPFVSFTQETSATFTGQPGSRYAFYSIAWDKALNMEDTPTAPDVTTTIDLCPDDPAKIVPGVCGCGVADSDSDGDGVADCLDAGQDFAVTKISAPQSVSLTDPVPERTKRIKVQIQNRGPMTETIPDMTALANLVEVELVSLGLCGAPTPILEKPARFPVAVKSKQKLTVTFAVTFTCANDAAKSTDADPGHDDYSVTARVQRAALGGGPDTHPADDICPRSVTPPFVIDPNPDGTIKDKGCGEKKGDKTFGGPVLMDVVVRP
jgi:hypothetical protein